MRGMIRGAVYGQRQLMLRARVMGQHGSNARPLHQAIAEEFEAGFRHNQASGGRRLPVGGWAPLALSTLRRKRGIKAVILNDTGAMQGGWRSRANTKYAHIENAERYALFHQKGTRKMPARRLFPSDAYMLEWAIGIVRRLFGFTPGRAGVRSA